MKKIGLLISTMNSGGAERVVSHLTRILGEKYEVHLILFLISSSDRGKFANHAAFFLGD